MKWTAEEHGPFGWELSFDGQRVPPGPVGGKFVFECEDGGDGYIRYWKTAPGKGGPDTSRDYLERGNVTLTRKQG